jgi:2-polyprenyl-3-methyl-5-hydroxy-6-metoxy-1,4-benzoquinol methylase
MDELTTVDHWDDVWAGDVRLRLPSSFVISTRNFQRLLRRHVRPGDRFLEIGCAPGKLLAWVAAALKANVSGLDYSEKGLATARRLFKALHLAADFRCEDVRQTTFPSAAFDVVVSFGVIEHFDDPRDVVSRHLDLVKPGGTALMTVPNYRGIYGRLRRYFDAKSLLYHNLDIMTCEGLAALVPQSEAAGARAYPAGRLSPWQVCLGKRWPVPLARCVDHLANVAALLQPFDVPALCPMLVLEITRSTADRHAPV